MSRRTRRLTPKAGPTTPANVPEVKKAPAKPALRSPEDEEGALWDSFRQK